MKRLILAVVLVLLVLSSAYEFEMLEAALIPPQLPRMSPAVRWVHAPTTALRGKIRVRGTQPYFYFFNSCTSAATGNWNSAGTWTSCGGTFPGVADTVTLATGFTVTCPTGVTCSANTVTNAGTGSYQDTPSSILVIDPGACSTSTQALKWLGTGTFTLNGTLQAGWGASNTTHTGGVPQCTTAHSPAILVTGGSFIANPGSVMYLLGDLQQQKITAGATVQWYPASITFIPCGTPTCTAAANWQFNFAYSASGNTNVFIGNPSPTAAYTTVTADQTYNSSGYWFYSETTATHAGGQWSHVKFMNCGTATVFCITQTGATTAFNVDHLLFLGPEGAPDLGWPTSLGGTFDSITLLNTYNSVGGQMAIFTQTGAWTGGTRVLSNIVAYNSTKSGSAVNVQIQADHVRCGQSLELDGTSVECYHGYNSQLTSMFVTSFNLGVRNLIMIDDSGQNPISAYNLEDNALSFAENLVFFQKGARSHPFNGQTPQSLAATGFSNVWFDVNWGSNGNNAGNYGNNVDTNWILSGGGWVGQDFGVSYPAITYTANYSALYGQSLFIGENSSTPTVVAMVRGFLTYYPPTSGTGAYMQPAGFGQRQTLLPTLWDYNVSYGVTGSGLAWTGGGAMYYGGLDANGTYSYLNVANSAAHFGTTTNCATPSATCFGHMTRTTDSSSDLTHFTPTTGTINFLNSIALGSQSATKVRPGDYLMNESNSLRTWARITGVTATQLTLSGTNQDPNWSTHGFYDDTGADWAVVPGWVCNGDCSYSGSGTVAVYGVDFGAHDFVAEPNMRSPTATGCTWYNAMAGAALNCTNWSTGTSSLALITVGTGSTVGQIVPATSFGTVGVGDWVMVCKNPPNIASCYYPAVQITGFSGGNANVAPNLSTAPVSGDTVIWVTDLEDIANALVTLNGFDKNGNQLTPTQQASYAWATAPNAIKYAQMVATPMSGAMSNYYAVADVWNGSNSYSNGQIALRNCYWYISIDTTPTSGFDPLTSPAHWQPTGGWGCNPGAAQAFNVTVMQ